MKWNELKKGEKELTEHVECDKQANMLKNFFTSNLPLGAVS